MFQLFIEAMKEFPGRTLQDDLVRECCFEIRHMHKPLIARYLGPTLDAQQKSNIVLGHPETVAVGAQIILKTGGSHGTM